MRIAYIGRFDHPWNEEGIATTLETLGHTVIRLPEVGFDMEAYKEALPTVQAVLWAKLRIPGDRQLVVRLARAAKVPTVCWVFDLYWGLGRSYLIRAKDPTFQADLVCSTDGGHEEEWAQCGIQHRLLRQGILPKYAYRAPAGNVPGKPKVVFVGSSNPAYPYRDLALKKVTEWYGRDFQWMGQADGVRGNRLNILYSTVPVCFGDSVYSPNYWSNRVYETVGRGGLLVHPAVPGLDAEFTPYEHYIPYTHGDWAGLQEALAYYTKRWEAGEAIRQGGFAHCKANHTFLHRCKELVGYIKQL